MASPALPPFMQSETNKLKPRTIKTDEYNIPHTTGSQPAQQKQEVNKSMEIAVLATEISWSGESAKEGFAREDFMGKSSDYESDVSISSDGNSESRRGSYDFVSAQESVGSSDGELSEDSDTISGSGSGVEYSDEEGSGVSGSGSEDHDGDKKVVKFSSSTKGCDDENDGVDKHRRLFGTSSLPLVTVSREDTEFQPEPPEQFLWRSVSSGSHLFQDEDLDALDLPDDTDGANDSHSLTRKPAVRRKGFAWSSRTLQRDSSSSGPGQGGRAPISAGGRDLPPFRSTGKDEGTKPHKSQTTNVQVDATWPNQTVCRADAKRPHPSRLIDPEDSKNRTSRSASLPSDLTSNSPYHSERKKTKGEGGMVENSEYFLENVMEYNARIHGLYDSNIMDTELSNSNSRLNQQDVQPDDSLALPAYAKEELGYTNGYSSSSPSVSKRSSLSEWSDVSPDCNRDESPSYRRVVTNQNNSTVPADSPQRRQQSEESASLERASSASSSMDTGHFNKVSVSNISRESSGSSSQSSRHTARSQFFQHYDDYINQLSTTSQNSAKEELATQSTALISESSSKTPFTPTPLRTPTPPHQTTTPIPSSNKISNSATDSSTPKDTFKLTRSSEKSLRRSGRRGSTSRYDGLSSRTGFSRSSKRRDHGSSSEAGNRNSQGFVSYVSRVVAEIIESERTYISSLQDIIKGYSEPMEKVLTTIDAKKDLQCLFSNIKEIYKFGCSFLADLESAGTDCVKVAQCFVRHNKGFVIYTDYCTNYPRAVEVLTRFMQHPRLSELCKERQLALGHGLPLGAYLLKPVQRILKYHLLLHNIVKSYERDKEGAEVLEQAFRHMTEMAHHINEMKRKHEHAVRIQEIQSQLEDYMGEDLTRLGELVLEGTFKIYGAKASRQVFLFERGLLVSKKKAGGMLSCKAFIQCSNLMLVEVIPNEPLSFHIIPFDNPRTQYTLQARNMEQKIRWCQDIKQLILESFKGRIPDSVKHLIMQLGREHKDDYIPKEALEAGRRNQHTAPEYLEKRKFRGKSGSRLPDFGLLKPQKGKRGNTGAINRKNEERNKETVPVDIGRRSKSKSPERRYQVQPKQTAATRGRSQSSSAFNIAAIKPSVLNASNQAINESTLTAIGALIPVALRTSPESPSHKNNFHHPGSVLPDMEVETPVTLTRHTQRPDSFLLANSQSVLSKDLTEMMAESCGSFVTTNSELPDSGSSERHSSLAETDNVKTKMPNSAPESKKESHSAPVPGKEPNSAPMLGKEPNLAFESRKESILAPGFEKESYLNTEVVTVVPESDESNSGKVGDVAITNTVDYLIVHKDSQGEVDPYVNQVHFKQQPVSGPAVLTSSGWNAAKEAEINNTSINKHAVENFDLTYTEDQEKKQIKEINDDTLSKRIYENVDIIHTGDHKMQGDSLIKDSGSLDNIQIEEINRKEQNPDADNSDRESAVNIESSQVKKIPRLPRRAAREQAHDHLPDAHTTKDKARLTSWGSAEKLTNGSIEDLSYLNEDPWVRNHDANSSFEHQILSDPDSSLPTSPSRSNLKGYSHSGGAEAKQVMKNKENIDWLVYLNRNSPPLSALHHSATEFESTSSRKDLSNEDNLKTKPNRPLDIPHLTPPRKLHLGNVQKSTDSLTASPRAGSYFHRPNTGGISSSWTSRRVNAFGISPIKVTKVKPVSFSLGNLVRSSSGSISESDKMSDAAETKIRPLSLNTDKQTDEGKRLIEEMREYIDKFVESQRDTRESITKAVEDAANVNRHSTVSSISSSSDESRCNATSDEGRVGSLKNKLSSWTKGTGSRNESEISCASASASDEEVGQDQVRTRSNRRSDESVGRSRGPHFEERQLESVLREHSLGSSKLGSRMAHFVPPSPEHSSTPPASAFQSNDLVSLKPDEITSGPDTAGQSVKSPIETKLPPGPSVLTQKDSRTSINCGHQHSDSGLSCNSCESVVVDSPPSTKKVSLDISQLGKDSSEAEVFSWKEQTPSKRGIGDLERSDSTESLQSNDSYYERRFSATFEPNIFPEMTETNRSHEQTLKESFLLKKSIREYVKDLEEKFRTQSPKVVEMRRREPGTMIRQRLQSLRESSLNSWRSSSLNSSNSTRGDKNIPVISQHPPTSVVKNTTTLDNNASSRIHTRILSSRTLLSKSVENISRLQDSAHLSRFSRDSLSFSPKSKENLQSEESESYSPRAQSSFSLDTKHAGHEMDATRFHYRVPERQSSFSGNQFIHRAQSNSQLSLTELDYPSSPALQSFKSLNRLNEPIHSEDDVIVTKGWVKSLISKFQVVS